MKRVSLFLIICSFTFSGCFSPWQPDNETAIIINFGPGRTAWQPFHEIADSLTHIITLSGPAGNHEIELDSGVITARIMVNPGQWEITVRAFLGEDLYAEGAASINVTARRSNPVDIQMNYTTEPGAEPEPEPDSINIEISWSPDRGGIAAGPDIESPVRISQFAGNRLPSHFTAAFTDDFDNIQWFVHGYPIPGQNDDRVTIQAEDFNSGTYQLMVIAVINGIPYSTGIYFTVAGPGETENTALPGTAENPFRIATEAELRKAGTQTFAGGWTLNAHYLMTADITLSEPARPGMSNWTPIGTGETAGIFTGSFDGGGYTITGLTIDSVNSDQGMFGYIGAGGTVKNLGLKNVSIRGFSNVGGIAGRNTMGTIENCFTTGTVEGSSGQCIGGIAGFNTGSESNRAIIRNCYSVCLVYGNNNVGGIAGENDRGVIQNCVALNPNVSSTGNFSYVGRIAGYYNGGTLNNNYGRAGMEIKSFDRTGLNITVMDGEDVTLEQRNGLNWWQNTAFRAGQTDGMSEADWAVMLKHFPPDVPMMGNAAEPFLFDNETDLHKVGGESDGYGKWTLNAHNKLTANIEIAALGESNWPPLAFMTGITTFKRLSQEPMTAPGNSWPIKMAALRAFN